MAQLYDLMLLIDASAPDDRRQAIVDEVQALLEQRRRRSSSAHDWGTRKITFEIDHRPEADYQLFQFEAENDVLDRLNHTLKIMDGVLRFRIIRQRPGAPEVPPAPDPIAHAAVRGGRQPCRRPRRGRRAGRAGREAAEAPEPSEAPALPRPPRPPRLPRPRPPRPTLRLPPRPRPSRTSAVAAHRLTHVCDDSATNGGHSGVDRKIALTAIRSGSYIRTTKPETVRSPR